MLIYATVWCNYSFVSTNLQSNLSKVSYFLFSLLFFLHLFNCFKANSRALPQFIFCFLNFNNFLFFLFGYILSGEINLTLFLSHPSLHLVSTAQSLSYGLGNKVVISEMGWWV